MGFGATPTTGIKSQINVTPLVDVVLVLLIIFMIVTPMLEHGKTVDLPSSRATDPPRADDTPLVLSITQDGRVYVENVEIDPPTLRDRIASELRAHPGRRVLLKADRSLAIGSVRTVMDQARLAGAPGVALAVHEVKEP